MIPECELSAMSNEILADAVRIPVMESKDHRNIIMTWSHKYYTWYRIPVYLYITYII